MRTGRRIRHASLSVAVLTLLTLLACSSDQPTSVDDRSKHRSVEPTIVATSPLTGATGVSVRPAITAAFSEEMDASSLTSATFRLNGVDGTVSYASAVATLTPLQELAYGTTYRVTMSAAAKSAAGVPLAQEYSWSFTTEAAPVRPVTLDAMPLAAGKRWRYERADTASICAWSTGCSTSSYDRETFIIVDGPATWQARSAWRLFVFDYAKPVRAEPGFKVTTEYLAQSSDALERWKGGANPWRKILAASNTPFRNGSFLLVDGPTHGDEMRMTSSSAAVPAGTYATSKVTHDYKETGQYATRDIFETRSEQYAAHVGLVRGDWSYSFDDNDPRGADISSRGRVILTHMDTGPFPELVVESEPSDSTPAAKPLVGFTIVSGDVAVGDAGSTVRSANVGCTQECVNPNVSGKPVLQDWFRVTVDATRAIRLELDFDRRDAAANQPNDLDLYLFQQTAVGLRFVKASTSEPSVRELIAATLAPGTYFIAVQAWDTPGARVRYWLSAR